MAFTDARLRRHFLLIDLRICDIGILAQLGREGSPAPYRSRRRSPDRGAVPTMPRAAAEARRSVGMASMQQALPRPAGGFLSRNAESTLATRDWLPDRRAWPRDQCDFGRAIVGNGRDGQQRERDAAHEGPRAERSESGSNGERLGGLKRNRHQEASTPSMTPCGELAVHA
jgi:hypothetical protein